MPLPLFACIRLLIGGRRNCLDLGSAQHHAHQRAAQLTPLTCLQAAGERERAREALRACQGGAAAEAERLGMAAADAQGSMRRAQAALEACEGARSTCQGRLEGMGQGSERCWEALEAERVRAPLMLSC